MKQTIEYGIIGLGRFGTALAKSLANNHKEVLVIDNSESKVKQVRDEVSQAFVVDSLDKETLIAAGIQNCQTVIVCIGQQVDKSILVTLNVIGLGVPRVIAKAVSEDQGFVLQKIGAEVVYPEKDMAKRLAQRLLFKRLTDFIELDNDFVIFELKLSEKLVGKRLEELALRQKFNLNIVAIKHLGSSMIDIQPDYVFQSGDEMYIIGRKKDVAKFESFLDR